MARRRRSFRATLARSFPWSGSALPSRRSSLQHGGWRRLVTSSCCRRRVRATTCSRTMNNGAVSSNGSSRRVRAINGSRPRQGARRGIDGRSVVVTAGSALREDAFDTPSRAETGSNLRTRWRMGPEAQGLVLVSSVLLAFGLAVLYSASAFVAMNENHNSAFYLVRQLSGTAVGV